MRRRNFGGNPKTIGCLGCGCFCGIASAGAMAEHAANEAVNSLHAYKFVFGGART